MHPGVPGSLGGGYNAAIAVCDDLGLKRPSLDDVFLRLTGHRAEETTDETEGVAP